MPSNALQITDPNADSDNPLAQAMPSPNWQPPVPGYDPLPPDNEASSPLELWLAQQRAKNNAKGFEPLPGITSGAPPKPWGLDRSQLPQQQQKPAYESGFIANVLNRFRPMDVRSDPRMKYQPQLRAFKMPGGGTVYLPIAPGVQGYDPLAPDIFGRSPYSSEFNSQSWRSPYDEQQT